ncbi:MAG: hypothetical protein AAF687_06045 [Pseudomonadota bacterium]
MSISKRTAIMWWTGGLIAFAIVLYVHVPLATSGVPGGIADHQSAPDAATVNAIQQSWQADGLRQTAVIAMISDLLFIGIFGVGCVLAGMHYRARDAAALRGLGWGAFVCGLVFLVTDYGETISQLVQLVQNSGDDGLSAFASTMRPIKMLSWIGGFLTVIAALVLDRLKSRTA